MVCDESLLSGATVIISDCNEDVASGPRVELVIDPSFNVGLSPYLVILPDFVESSEVLVHISVGIHACPQGFSVVGVVTTVEVLLSSIINDGNTLSEH